MNEHVFAFVAVIRILFNTKSSESKIIQVNLKRPEVSDKDINSQIELTTSDEQGVFEVLRNDIRLLIHLVIGERHFRLILPTLQLCQFSYQKYALALCSVRGFHDPGSIRLATELFNEDIIVAWEDVCQRDDIHINVSAQFVLFSEW